MRSRGRGSPGPVRACRRDGENGWEDGFGTDGAACPVLLPTCSRSCGRLRLDVDLLVFQPDLHRLAAQVLGDVLEHLVMTGDRDEFGMELATEDPRLLVALRPRQRATAQRAVDVHRTVAAHLCPGAAP